MRNAFAPRCRVVLASVLACALASTTLACTTYRDQLARSQAALDHNEHGRALGLLRALEPDLSRLSTPEQAQYAYLRGMTDHRIGHRDDARHWLAIANAYEDGAPGTLPADWRTRMTGALEELNETVYSTR